MDEGRTPRTRDRLGRSLAALWLIAGLAIAPPRADAGGPGDEPRAGTKASVELDAIRSWALFRLRSVKDWDRRIVEEEKALGRVSGEIKELIVAIEAERHKGVGTLQLSVFRSRGGAVAIPESGRDRVIIADSDGTLHFRIFDHEGARIKDEDEARLAAKSGRIADLKGRLDRLGASGEIPSPAREPIVFAVTSLLDLDNDTDYFDRLDAANRRIDEAATDLQAAIDRSRTLPPNVARLVLEAAEVRLQDARLEREDMERYTLPGRIEAAGVALRATIRGMDARLSALKRRETQGRSRLEALRKQDEGELSDPEAKILEFLRESDRLRREGRPERAEESLAEATRLWRREMARQLEAGLRDDRCRPGRAAGGTPTPAPGR